ncbi:MAG: hypothetical protein SF339_01210 [Blastocatellia bacterium]|nr:hypothetical protein [Blastocatellia bacterium]
MEKKELQNTNAGIENEGGAEGRRSFMKGMVAGSVAVGAMATTIAAATPANAATATQLPYTLLAKPRAQTAKIRVSFDQRRQPKLYDLQKTLEELLGRVGCLNCGLGGIDIELRLDEVINPSNGGFAAVVEGEILQR